MKRLLLIALAACKTAPAVVAEPDEEPKLVSLIVPTENAEPAVRQLVEQVLPALGQCGAVVPARGEPAFTDDRGYDDLVEVVVVKTSEPSTLWQTELDAVSVEAALSDRDCVRLMLKTRIGAPLATLPSMTRFKLSYRFRPTAGQRERLKQEADVTLHAFCDRLGKSPRLSEAPVETWLAALKEVQVQSERLRLELEATPPALSHVDASRARSILAAALHDTFQEYGLRVVCGALPDVPPDAP